MTLKTSDLLIYPNRCQTRDVLAGLQNTIGSLTAHAEEFLSELEAACLESGIDFAYAAAHSANETDYWTSFYFVNRRNGFGIGITGEPGVDGPLFPSYMACAQFFAAELLMKVRKPLGNFTNARQYAPQKYDDVKAIVAGSLGTFPTVERIADLGKTFGPNGRECVWFCDNSGAEAIVQKARALIPNVANQTSGGPIPMPTEPFPANVRVALVHRGNVPLEKADAWFTIHNTGNTVPAESERSFFAQGGGSQGVLVHGVVDETEIIQLTEFWKQGIHAGNTEGNHTSIAMEMTARENVFDNVERNGARFMAMVYTRDPRLDWTGAEHFNFSPERTIDHRGWAGANPDCPHVLIARHNGQDVQFMIDLAKTFMKGVTPAPVPKPKPHIVGHEADGTGATFQDPDGNTWAWYNQIMRPKHSVQTYEYANVDAARKGPLLPTGKGIRVYYLVAANDPANHPDIWGTTRLGWRFRLRDMLR